MKATEKYFPVVLFIMLYKVVLTFESVDEIPWCDHSNKSYWAVLSFDTVWTKWCMLWQSRQSLFGCDIIWYALATSFCYFKTSQFFRACLHEGGGPQVGEVTCGGSPHLLCKRDHIKMRDCMDRRVTPPKRVTSPIWGPPPPCKQALSFYEFWSEFTCS